MGLIEPIGEDNRDFVGSLAKGLRVIAAFDETRTSMNVADVAKATDMTRAGARRLLLTLHSLGYVRSDGRNYSLAPKVLELGFSYLTSQNWLAAVDPVLEALRDELEEAVSITVLDGADVVYIARYPVNRVMTMSMDIGSRKPAFCTAMGRVLLSGLDDRRLNEILAQTEMKPLTAQTRTSLADVLAAVEEVRRLGYALVDRELEESLVAISVPLINTRGDVLAAVNVCGHPAHLSMDDLTGRCLPALKAASARIAKFLV